MLWAPAVDGAVVMSTRGGDFELTVGQDPAIGYLDHDAKSVQLYLEDVVHVPGADARSRGASVVQRIAR